MLSTFGLPRTCRNTPTTARPSGWLAASPKLEYLVFQCTKWSWKHKERLLLSNYTGKLKWMQFMQFIFFVALFFFFTKLKYTSNVYLSRILDSAHSVFRAPVIRSSPVEMELLEPVCARDGSICQSCKSKNLLLNIELNECCIETWFCTNFVKGMAVKW